MKSFRPVAEAAALGASAPGLLLAERAKAGVISVRLEVETNKPGTVIRTTCRDVPQGPEIKENVRPDRETAIRTHPPPQPPPEETKMALLRPLRPRGAQPAPAQGNLVPKLGHLPKERPCRARLPPAEAAWDWAEPSWPAQSAAWSEA